MGLVSFGGVLRWLTPGMGLRQRYRIVDSLLESEIVFNYTWKDVSVIPCGPLPPQAFVLAVTPLLDARAVAALVDLRSVATTSRSSRSPPLFVVPGPR